MKSVGRAWTGLTWPGRKQVARFCERGNVHCDIHQFLKFKNIPTSVLYYNIVFTNKTLEPDMF